MLDGKRILVVDDDPVLRQTLGLVLTRAGYQVVEAEDGQAAWEIIQDDHVRMIITDWNMPVMDGPELVRRVRAAALPGYTYIMMLTAAALKPDVIKGLEAGVDDYLTKPFDMAELRARVAIGARILDVEANLMQSLDQVKELAVRDGLTGLYNRRAFDQRLAEEVQRAERYRRPLALIMIDIDGFKEYNDRFGHPQGDQVLREMAGLFAACVRSTDFVARYGGEEFSIILPETGLANAVTVARQIQMRVAAHRFAQALNVPANAGGSLAYAGADEAASQGVTVSLGVAAHTSAQPGALPLLWAADQALYRAKRGGRNRVMVNDQVGG